MSQPAFYCEPEDEYRDTVVEQGQRLVLIAQSFAGRDWSPCFRGSRRSCDKDVQPFALMVGVPAKHIGWMSAYGERVDLPLEGTGSWTCPHTGDNYQLLDHHLIHSPA